MNKLLVFIIFFFVSSCAFKDTIIKNAPYFVAARANSRLDLSDKQTTELEKKVEDTLYKIHGDIVVLRDEILEMNLANLQSAKVLERIFPAYKNISRHVNEVLSWLLCSLDKEQLDSFYKSLETQNEAIEKKIKSGSEKIIIERYENFFGELTDNQEKLVKDASPIFQAQLKDRLAIRYATQKKMKLIIKRNSQIDLENLFNSTIEYREYARRNRDFFAFLDNFTKTASVEQTQYFNEKVAAIIGWVNLYLKYYKVKSNNR